MSVRQRAEGRQIKKQEGRRYKWKKGEERERGWRGRKAAAAAAAVLVVAANTLHTKTFT